MNQLHQQILSSLRIIKIIDSNQYLDIDRNYTILGVYDDTFMNNITASIYFQTWESTKTSLTNLFCEEIPDMANQLIKQNKQKELQKIVILLKDAKKGLVNLSELYKKTPMKISFMDTIIDDYLNTQIDYIEDYLSELNN